MNTSLSKATMLLSLLWPALLFGQSKAPELSLVNTVDKTLEQVRSNNKIDADSAQKILSNWGGYKLINETGRDYIFYLNNATFGKMPVRVYIPPGYNSANKYMCVLMLHGATSRGHFSDIDSLNIFDSDVLFNTLKTQNAIIVRPVSDRDKKFDWAVNRLGGRDGDSPNLSYIALHDMMIALKKVLNIDDNKVFAFGHSDGSDGAVGMGVYLPNMFAGIVAYNPMLTNIFATDFYIRNIKNRPLYTVHSDLDNIRPIQQQRVIIDSLLKISDKVLYKEYIGYHHEDKHLDKDVPMACKFISTISRNPYPTKIYWEVASAELFNTCDWVTITAIDPSAGMAAWHHPLVIGSYNKVNKTWEKNHNYYEFVHKSAAVKATYNTNIFAIQTSGVKEVELLISPVMVNLEEPVIVIANGKQVFSGKVTADKNFLLKNFQKTMDRQTLWVNSIKVAVN